MKQTRIHDTVAPRRRACNCALAASVALLSLATTASAQVLYSQPNDRPSATSFFSDAVPGQFFSQRMADDFVLTGSDPIAGVRWWGGSQNYQYADMRNMVSFTVLLMGDSEGRPDPNDILAVKTVATAGTNPTATGSALFGGGTQYEQTLSFDAPVPVQAGLTYWLSIGATLQAPAGDAWVWSASSVGNRIDATDFFTGAGFIVFDPSKDMAFEVLGVPEPATGALLSLLAAAAIRHRR